MIAPTGTPRRPPALRLSQLLPSRPVPAGKEAERGEVTRQHLRGSNLMLVGRLVSLGINFLVNVLTVRYLSKSDYGAFSYGLTIGTAGASFLLFGMPRAVARFAALHQERKDFGAMFGSLVLSTGVVATLGAAVLALALFLRVQLLEPFVSDPLALALLLILIALAPLQALDNLFQTMLTVFAGAGTIFFRRFVLAPLLRLSAVLSVLAWGGSVRFLAWAYLVASILGVLIYGPMLRHALVRAGLLRHFSLANLRFPVRETFGFGLPLVVADAFIALRLPIAVVLLESWCGTREVGDFSAFLKISGLNTIVLQSMKLLFMPVASRLFARGDHAGLDDLYWKTTIWIAVATFPILVPCIAMSDTMALIINGREYVDSSAVLVVLAIGEYVNAAMGLNTYTLHVYARVRFVFLTTILATLVGVGLGLWLIPAHGALGAALAYTSALVLQNILHHWGLHRLTRVEMFRREYMGVYASLAGAALLLVAVDTWASPPLVVEAVLVALASLGLLRLHRETMDLTHVFPELRKLPWLMWILGTR